MLLFVFVIMTIAGILMLACFDNGIEYLGVVILVIGGFGAVISGLVAADAHIGVDGYIAKMDTRYETLVYQYENDIYDNDNDLGKRELIEDIQAWNEDLAYRREVQNDLWLGIFWPNIFDQFEFIELEG